MSYRVAVALGSNMGDRLSRLREAVAALRDVGRVEAVSSLYETEPVGGPEQGAYLNAVCVLTTTQEPAKLLAALHRIEGESGRVREQRWGPRPLDLDLISVVDKGGHTVRVHTEEVVVPHPRAHLRRFVLEPLAEVWPEAPVGEAATARDRLAAVQDQDVEVLGPEWVAGRLAAARGLLAVQGLLLGGYGAIVLTTGQVPRLRHPATAAGAALTAAGTGLVLAAVKSLGPALSPYPEPRPGTELVAVGPYRLMRHPIYSGLVLALAGVATATRAPAGVGAALVVGGFFGLKARYEERRMRLGVPGYADYQRQVRGRLLPGSNAST